MSADLLETVRLLHRVFGFLSQQSADQLSGILDGRLRLAVAGPPPEEETAPPPVPKARRPRAIEKVEKKADKDPARAGTDYSAIAAELRSLDSVDAGSAYLDGLKLRGRKPARTDLMAVAEVMGLTLPKGATVAIARRRLLEHAIGARRKYAGLESW